MSQSNNEIPEDVFQTEFGGRSFVDQKNEQRGEARTVLAFWGLLALIGGPAVLVAVAVIIVSLKDCWAKMC
ncbi:MAG TPA: hypothetical protein PK264_09135 [Hyphomicrobiaceae bacterium]|nr:hypothetical protein [Hyphomicrobiaceae bacterium]